MVFENLFKKIASMKVLIGMVFVIIALIVGIFYVDREMKTVSLIKISNLSKSFSDKKISIDEQARISLLSTVNEMVKKINPEKKIDKIKDAAVRTDSLNLRILNKKPDSEREVFFLLDIPSLKQTYRVTQIVSYQGQNSSVYVDCPKKEDLIYSDFQCWDRFYRKNQERDPIYTVTPAHQEDHGFRIKARQNRDKNGKLVIMVEILSKKPAKREAIKDLANEYLTKRGIKLEDYTVLYE